MNFWQVNPLRVVARLATHRPAWRIIAAIAPQRFPRSLNYWLAVLERALLTYRSAVARADASLDSVSALKLLDLVDELATAAGEYFIWIAIVGGSGYKNEGALASFYRRQFAPRIGGSHQTLLVGLGTSAGRRPLHAVTSLDWMHPTLGELPVTGAVDHADVAARRNQATAKRQTAETEARAALACSPRLLVRFESLPAQAQGAALLRDAVVDPFTLGWPVMRRALRRAGEALVERGIA
jgi:pyruvate,water dikinase